MPVSIPALVNALISLTNEAERLRSENRVLRAYVEEVRAQGQGQWEDEDVPVHPEGKGCCGEGCEGGCQEEGEEVDG